MAIGFSEWNQRNSDTERRTGVPNLWRGAGGANFEAVYMCRSPNKVQPMCTVGVENPCVGVAMLPTTA